MVSVSRYSRLNAVVGGSSASSSRRGGSNNRRIVNVSVVVTLLVLVLCWCVCLILLSSSSSQSKSSSSSGISGLRSSKTTTGTGTTTTTTAADTRTTTTTTEHSLRPKNLSRTPPNHVTATVDVKGNLGPISVILQSIPGKDWLHDRWQAASDMHGTNIPGQHWIELDFGGGSSSNGDASGSDSTVHNAVIATSIVLDWETAYCDKYKLEASMEPITNNPSNKDIWSLFDGTSADASNRRSVEEKGQSPGVKEKRPLHVIHTISLGNDDDGTGVGDHHDVSNNNNHNNNRPFRYLRLHILKSATGWGVSLWQFDVFGYIARDVVQ